jgi:hypothetical protein
MAAGDFCFGSARGQVQERVRLDLGPRFGAYGSERRLSADPVLATSRSPFAVTRVAVRATPSVGTKRDDPVAGLDTDVAIEALV